jgi:hypothetical protein
VSGGSAGARRASALVVVTGLPRSGTSMAMRMLAAGGMDLVADGSRPADAGNPHGYFEDDRTKRLRQDASWLRACAGKAVKIVLPLLPCVPRDLACDVVVLRRPIAEVLASQRALLELRGLAAGPEADASLAAAFARSEREAERWWSGRSAVRTVELDYAAALDDPAGSAARLAAFLARPLDTAAMAAAVDAGLGRHRARSHAAARIVPTP